MRKVSWLMLTVILGICVAQAQNKTWNLSNDIRANGSQISFNQGTNGVWYFMESASLLHQPWTYSFLPDYQVLCGLPSEKKINGLACWRDVSYQDELPAVSVNFTDQTQYQTVVIPPRAVHFHPAADRLAIIAWKSPLSTLLKISGAFTDLDPACGNGVLWFIERNDQPLASGDIANGGAEAFNLAGVNVKKGQVLYFMSDPKNGDYACDTTMIELTISAL